MRCETWTGSVSGKLRHENERLRVDRNDSQRGETGKHLVHDIAVLQVGADVCLSLLFEGWYVVLK